MKNKFLLLFLSLHLLLSAEKVALVTGGAGFLGSHLCERLLKDGYRVLCLDNLYTGSLNTVDHLMDNPSFQLIEHDITKPFDPAIAIDEIYNLACPASPIHYQKEPIKTFKVSVLGSLNLLDLANKYNAKIFQASTSEVYGDPLEHPQKEEYWGYVNPNGIRSCYDEGKRGAESLFFDYHRQYGTRIKVGRIFNTYGPHMSPNDGRVVSNFIVQALKGEEITIYGTGNQTRSFCYVSDLIDAIVSLMQTEDTITGPINIGNPGEFTMIELAVKVVELTGSRSQIVFQPLPKDDPKRRCPDITKAKDCLGWEPKVTLEEGLKKTIPYFKNLIAE